MKIRERIAQVVRDLRDLEVIRPGIDKITYSLLDYHQITITVSCCDSYPDASLRCLTIWEAFKDEFSREEIILEGSENNKITFVFLRTKQTDKEGS